MYSVEQTKVVKMAYQLNDKCVNPQSIEKSNVSLAASVFSESTRNGMQYYVENGYSQWEGTLNFLNLIGKWWGPSKGKHKPDINSEPITDDNYQRIAEFFKIFFYRREFQDGRIIFTSDQLGK